MRPVLALVNVTKRYPGTVAVDALKGIDVNIERGELVAIVGRSGSGKTTLLQILGTLDRPTTGEVLVDGTNITALSDDVIADLRARTIGFVFQQFMLIATLSSRSNVALGALYTVAERRLRFQLADAALQRVSLGHRLHHRASQLSGGEKQRTAIARALILQPQVVLADEPTGNLDSRSGKEVLELLYSLTSSGTAVVIVTHDFAIARKADRVLEVIDGRLVRNSS